jgi:hypothetical protein
MKMACVIAFFFLLPIVIINGQDQHEPSIYDNMVIAWRKFLQEFLLQGNNKQKLLLLERRILYCAPSKDGRHSGLCYLSVGKDGQPKIARCHDETVQLPEGYIVD